LVSIPTDKFIEKKKALLVKLKPSFSQCLQTLSLLPTPHSGFICPLLSVAVGAGFAMLVSLNLLFYIIFWINTSPKELTASTINPEDGDSVPLARWFVCARPDRNVADRKSPP
jgi:hypothetical protein